MQATMDTRPEDLILTPVIKEAGKLKYVASPLVTAMIKGGVCVLDEGNRMSEKSWASLAPLLDSRRYVESIIGGVKIHAHPEFRFVATMNDDASTYEIPEYINSRLQPQIYLDFPSENEEMEILRKNLPYTSDELLEKVCSFLRKSHDLNEEYTVRDGINIASYAMRLVKFRKSTPDKSLRDAVTMILGPEAAAIIDRKLTSIKDSISPFTGPKGLV
jgi:MoxR-like ATPase